MFKSSNCYNILKTVKSYEKFIFLALFSSLLLLSCIEKNEKIVQSTGKLNSLSVIIDDQLWNGEIGDSIRNKFASPVIGLPQEEPLFTINQYPVKLLEGFMNKSRNIIVIKKENKSAFIIDEDEFAKPQIVVHISGNTVQEILDSIHNNSELIIDKIKSSEIVELQKSYSKKLFNTKKIKKRFNINIAIPESYKLTIRRNKFAWIKKEISGGSCSILIYEIPLINIENKRKATKEIIKKRDSISNLYIHGNVAKSIMVTDKNYFPYASKTLINDKKTIETKGNWEMTNDNMSGPFVNYTIRDKRRNRMLVLEGFCYAPSKEKRDLMLELEAIIKSVKFL